MVELLERQLRAHVVGLGGAGMSAIAAVLSAMGHCVSGSDQRPSAVLDRLSAAGISAAVGHDPANVRGVDLVTFSAAVRSSNVELAEARRLGVPVLSRGEMLAQICATKRTVAVSGAHGKTTTTAMLAALLAGSGFDPCYIVGGELPGGKGGAHWGSGQWLVVEADESDGTFLRLQAEAVVVTSVGADHLDHYGDLTAIEQAFAHFVSAAPGPKVICTDDPGAAQLSGAATATYGATEAAGFMARDVQLGATSASFELFALGRDLGRFSLKVPGLHNVVNAAGALAMAIELGAEVEPARAALAEYQGVGRRFEVLGEREGVTYVDDYAHNPDKVRAALAAARAGGWGRVVAVFQPHLYSRTVTLLEEYATAFGDADVLYVTDIYGAREDPVPGVDGGLLADAVRGANRRTEIHYVAERPALLAEVRSCLRPGDLCITMSAGDLTNLYGQLNEKPAPDGGGAARDE